MAIEIDSKTGGTLLLKYWLQRKNTNKKLNVFSHVYLDKKIEKSRKRAEFCMFHILNAVHHILKDKIFWEEQKR